MSLNYEDSQEGQSEHANLKGTAVVCDIQERQLECKYLLYVYLRAINSLTTVGYLLEVFIRLWIPSMVRIFTSAWS